MTIPGKRPATKLFPENSSANRSAVSVISISSRVLGEVDAVADGEDCDTTSSVDVALREFELVDNAELVGVVVVEEVVAAIPGHGVVFVASEDEVVEGPANVVSH